MGGGIGLRQNLAAQPQAFILSISICTVWMPSRQFFNGEFWNKRANDRKDILTYRKFVKVMTALN